MTIGTQGIPGGTGGSAAVDTIAGAAYQFGKIVDGTPDSTNKLIINSSGEALVNPNAACRVSSVTSSKPNVTTSSTTILAANANRKGGWIKNKSDVSIWVSFGGVAVNTAPSELEPGDVLKFSDDRWIYTGDVNAIHYGVGNKAVELVEV